MPSPEPPPSSDEHPAASGCGRASPPAPSRHQGPSCPLPAARSSSPRRRPAAAGPRSRSGQAVGESAVSESRPWRETVYGLQCPIESLDRPTTPGRTGFPRVFDGSQSPIAWHLGLGPYRSSAARAIGASGGAAATRGICARRGVEATQPRLARDRIEAGEPAATRRAALAGGPPVEARDGPATYSDSALQRTGEPMPKPSAKIRSTHSAGRSKASTPSLRLPLEPWLAEKPRPRTAKASQISQELSPS